MKSPPPVVCLSSSDARFAWLTLGPAFDISTKMAADAELDDLEVDWKQLEDDQTRPRYLNGFVQKSQEQFNSKDVSCLKRSLVDLLEGRDAVSVGDIQSLVGLFAQDEGFLEGTLEMETNAFDVRHEECRMRVCASIATLALRRLDECSSALDDVPGNEMASERPETTSKQHEMISKRHEAHDLLLFVLWFLKKSFCENKFLHNQDYLARILRNFKRIVRDHRCETFAGIRNVVLKITSLLLRTSVSLNDLKEFFSVFNNDLPVDRPLLDVFSSCVKTARPTPSSYFSLSSTRVRSHDILKNESSRGRFRFSTVVDDVAWFPECSSYGLTIWMQLESWRRRCRPCKNGRMVRRGSHLFALGNNNLRMTASITPNKKLSLELSSGGCIRADAGRVEFDRLSFERFRWHCLSLNVRQHMDSTNKYYSLECLATLDADEQYAELGGELHDPEQFESPSKAVLSHGQRRYCDDEIAYNLGTLHFFNYGASTNLARLHPRIMLALGPHAVVHHDSHLPPTSLLYKSILSQTNLKLSLADLCTNLDATKSSVAYIHTASNPDTFIHVKNVVKNNKVKSVIRYLEINDDDEDDDDDDDWSVVRNPCATLYDALVLSGGIRSLIFFCAKVIENSRDERTQSVAVALVFDAVKNDVAFAEEFNNIDGSALMRKLLSSAECISSFKLFQVMLEYATNSALSIEEVDSGTLARSYSLRRHPSNVLVVDAKFILDVICRHPWDHPDDAIWCLTFEALEFIVSAKCDEICSHMLMTCGIFSKMLDVFMERFNKRDIFKRRDSSSSSPIPSMSQATCDRCCGVLLNLVEGDQDGDRLEEYFHETIRHLLLFHPTTQVVVAHKRPSFYCTNKWEAGNAVESPSLLLKSSMGHEGRAGRPEDDELGRFHGNFSDDSDEVVHVSAGLLNVLMTIFKKFESQRRTKILRDATVLQVLFVLIISKHNVIRVNALKVIRVLLESADKEIYKIWSSCGNFHLLANQLHASEVDEEMLRAVFDVVFNSDVSSSDSLSTPSTSEGNLEDVVSPTSTLLLLGALHNLDCELSLCVISVLRQAFEEEDLMTSAIPEELLKNGIINVLCNKLLSMDERMQDDPKLLQAIFSLISSVASYAFFSSDSAFEYFPRIYHLIMKFEDSSPFPFGWGRNEVQRNVLEAIAAHVERNFLTGFALRNDRSTRSSTGSSRFSSDTNLNRLFRTSPSTSSVNSSSSRNESDSSSSSMDRFIRDARLSEKKFSARLEHLLRLSVESSVYAQMPSKEISCFLLKFLLQLNMTLKISHPKCFIHAALSKIQKSTSLLMASLLNAILHGSRNEGRMVDDFLSSVVSNPNFLHVLSKDIKVLWLKANLWKYTKENQMLISPEQLSTVERFRKCLLNLNDPSISSSSSLQSMDLEVMLSVSQYKKDVETKSNAWRKEVREARVDCDGHLEALQRRIDSIGRKHTQDIVGFQMSLNQKLQVRFQRAIIGRISTTILWKKLIESLSHERAVWHRADLGQRSWMSDPTEGPCGVRARLKKCHLTLPREFFLDTHQHKSRQRVHVPLQFILNDLDLDRCLSSLAFKLHSIQDVEYSSLCSLIVVSSSTLGYLFIAESNIFFVTHDDDTQVEVVHDADQIVVVDVSDVSFMSTQRYLLRDTALRICTTSGRSYLFAFQTTKERNDVHTLILKKRLPNLVSNPDLQTLVKNWQVGKTTNFEYLMKLNSCAGRSHDDLTQFPIFPFVLSDYNSGQINLGDPNIYRDLTKNIFAQTQAQAINRKNIFSQLEHEIPPRPNGARKPAYHSHNFPMNSVVVLYFNLRLPPFTQMFVNFQGGQFDYADRMFSSIAETHSILMKAISNDAKELTPEFFYSPEILENFEGFDFGENQRGVRVNDVALPPWCDGDARTFVLVHRQALESDQVSRNLPYWIDLVFGHKQRGKEAVPSLNVYHENAYYGTGVSDDDLEARALLSHIKTCGQVPKQLFTSPHPLPSFPDKKTTRDAGRSGTLSINTSQTIPISGVSGLKWGKFVGSPDSHSPFLVWSSHHREPITRFMCVLDVKLFALTSDKTVIKEPDSFWTAVHWNRPDGRIKLMNNARKFKHIKWTLMQYKITCCESLCHEGILIFGTDSGLIVVYRLNPEKPKFSSALEEGPTVLYGHSGEVTDVKACHPFKVFYTSSSDGTINYWDLNGMNLIRSVGDHARRVATLATSPTLGDLVSASHRPDGRVHSSRIMLHTINGKKVAEQTVKKDKVKCLVYSSRPEGRNVNVIAAGTKSGSIRFYSSWNLVLLSEVVPFGSITAIPSSIISLSFCLEDQYIVGSTKGNLIFFLSHKKEADLEGLEIIYV